MNDKLVKYFNLMDRARKTKSAHAEGTHNFVYFMEGCAILKRKKKTSGKLIAHAMPKEKYDHMQKVVASCIKRGARIPQMYAQRYYFNAQEKVTDYMEVQEQVSGKSVLDMVPYAALKNNLMRCKLYENAGISNPFSSARQDIDDAFKKDLGLLQEIPQEHYNGLLKTLTILKQSGLETDYVNPANFLYCPTTGFWVVDIGLYENPVSVTVPQAAETEATEFCEMITSFVSDYAEKGKDYSCFTNNIIEKVIVAQAEVCRTLPEPALVK